ncbi:hypothetical protein D9M68_747860 [compost metagenome]
MQPHVDEHRHRQVDARGNLIPGRFEQHRSTNGIASLASNLGGNTVVGAVEALAVVVLLVVRDLVQVGVVELCRQGRSIVNG